MLIIDGLMLEQLIFYTEDRISHDVLVLYGYKHYTSETKLEREN